MASEVIPFAWLLENVLTAFLLIAYLFYEIHYGRVNRAIGRMDGVVDVVLALARTSDGVDEEAVAERINGHTPDDLLEDG